jgi:Zn-dependent protease with chaperone function
MDVLLNWLLQGVTVAIAAAAGLRLIPQSPAQARYGFVCAAYLLVLVMPTLPPALAVFAIAVPTADLMPVSAGRITLPAVWWTSWTVTSGLWIAWAAFQTVRLAVDALAVRNARRHSRQCPHDVLAGLPYWAHVQTTGPPTRVVLSDRVRFAAVLGSGSPTIAIAPRLLTQLSAADLDRVLVHEWAHVQRRDDVAQLVQRLVRTIIGWHPAAWWLERELEFEREAACDELAVGVTGSAKRYAACLATLAALPRATVRPLPGLAVFSTSRLHSRLTRILAARSVTSARFSRAVAIGGAVGLAALALPVSHLRVVGSTAQWMPRPMAAAVRVEGMTATTSMASDRLPAPQSTSTSRRPYSNATMPSVPREQERSRGNVSPAGNEESPQSAGPVELLPSVAWPGGTQLLAPLDSPAPDIPVIADLAAAAAGAARPADAARASWAAAVDAGVAIGRNSKNAGVATAGFFTRFGKRIAGSF